MWGSFSNPNQGQKNKDAFLEYKAVDVLRQAVINRIQQKGFDPSQHHEKDHNTITVANRIRNRGKNKVTLTPQMQELPAEVTLMEISEDVEGEVESEGVGIESITDPLEPEPAVYQDSVITEPLEPEPSVNQDFVRNENSGQDLELLLNFH